MTRSDNPFGDLPEWKERQRLQEAQEQAGGHLGGFQQSNQYGHRRRSSMHLAKVMARRLAAARTRRGSLLPGADVGFTSVALQCSDERAPCGPGRI